MRRLLFVAAFPGALILSGSRMPGLTAQARPSLAPPIEHTYRSVGDVALKAFVFAPSPRPAARLGTPAP